MNDIPFREPCISMCQSHRILLVLCLSLIVVMVAWCALTGEPDLVERPPPLSLGFSLGAVDHASAVVQPDQPLDSLARVNATPCTNGALQVAVVSTQTRLPLPGVRMQLECLDATTGRIRELTSGLDGVARLEEVPSGDHRLRVGSLGVLLTSESAANVRRLRIQSGARLAVGVECAEAFACGLEFGVRKPYDVRFVWDVQLRVIPTHFLDREGYLELLATVKATWPAGVSVYFLSIPGGTTGTAHMFFSDGVQSTPTRMVSLRDFQLQRFDALEGVGSEWSSGRICLRVRSPSGQVLAPSADAVVARGWHATRSESVFGFRTTVLSCDSDNEMPPGRYRVTYGGAVPWAFTNSLKQVARRGIDVQRGTTTYIEIESSCEFGLVQVVSANQGPWAFQVGCRDELGVVRYGSPVFVADSRLLISLPQGDLAINEMGASGAPKPVWIHVGSDSEACEVKLGATAR